MSAKCVRNTIHAYHAAGLDALKERVHPGRSSRLTPEIITALRAEIDRGDRVWSSLTLAYAGPFGPSALNSRGHLR